MKTLKINLPLGQVLLQSLLWLCLFCVAIEVFARTPIAGTIFHYQSYGSSHPHFETQIISIKAREAQYGHIDCIFLGNSQVLYGIDPSVVEQVYLEKTGRSIRCQNFGLGGLTPISAAPLAELLIKNFHPSIIVFGTGLWDYSSSSATATKASIMSSPWVRYELGTFSIDGWFYENSYSYRTIFGMDRYLNNPNRENAHIDANGHATYSGHTDLTVTEQLEYFETLAKRPDITQPERDGLRDLLSLNSSEVKIIVIETPSDPAFYSVKRKARTLYPQFEKMLHIQTSLANSNLWLTQHSADIPTEDWYDLLHLNESGSVYFSRLLGEYLASIDPPIVDAKKP